MLFVGLPFPFCGPLHRVVMVGPSIAQTLGGLLRANLPGRYVTSNDRQAKIKTRPPRRSRHFACDRPKSRTRVKGGLSSRDQSRIARIQETRFRVGCREA